MTELLRNIVLQAVAIALLSGAVLAMLPGGALREVVRMVLGLWLLVSLLLPLQQLEWPKLSLLLPVQQQVQQENERTQDQAVAHALEHVLEQRAAELGENCTVTVTLSADEAGLLQIAHVRFGGVAPERQGEIMQMAQEECGVRQTQIEMVNQ